VGVLSLSRDARGDLVIDEIDLDGTRRVGAFARASSAWEAIDELDAPTVMPDHETVIEYHYLAA
jgi:hypothetical protein